ncbi:LMBR1 domain-containing protein 2 homolog A isoform X2 [Arabidopsis lyrata subsp. lyrata]|uniref:LMBR1 domain-containing protein 2 homolog A isoform X2 n=1 Tax=Arabidopsis lyrata subsp. lyrata TaxID=81972 RepID=UPI000A29B5E6|nr:LMBR1 domain-containing protein 2 homolog A isoform X2 [Arabidopsis lyrata subsp. lyrata]|eukprot:XP_020889749.1 LMBR1 domain-containing protein 2 homolog A isoform X2 [Arabidopsis lyrata subsp. lyrata]
MVYCEIWTSLICDETVTLSLQPDHPENGAISFLWSWSYWSTFLLTWAVVPLIQGFEDAGDFTVSERLKTSVHVNLVFYLVLGFIGLLGLILLVMMHRNWKGSILGYAMACSNTFGLVTGAFLLGFGLSEIPKTLWKNADWTTRQKVLSHKIAKIAVKLDNAHQELSNAIVVAQATSTQMSKRDPMRPYMNVIDAMLAKMFREDPSFKPQGGQLGENDMDYDTDEKSMATLRRHLRNAKDEYYRYKSEYLTYVTEALVLEDTMKNYERRDATGWKYISSFRATRTGKMGNLLDTLEFMWRCILKKQIQMVLAVVMGIMSAAILLAEATLLLSKLDLSLFSILISSVKSDELLVQAFAFVPLVYMCVCTYYSLFKIGMLMIYSLTPRQTSSVNLLMICSMIARYAPPISYNFINLIQLHSETIFEKKMGRIDDAVPVFGQRFNEIYPLIMVIYTLLVASNFFDRIFNYFGSWKRFRFQTETEDTDGFDPSGLMILKKERTWLEEGQKVGEHVLPLARNFNDVDIEPGSNFSENSSVEMKMSSSYDIDTVKGSSSKDDMSRKYGSAREAITNKYAAIREQQNKHSPSSMTKPENMSSAKVSLLETDNSGPSNGQGSGEPSSRLASTWRNMKLGIQNFKENVATKKFLPLRQSPETTTLTSTRVVTSSVPQSLDEIFQRLKNRSVEHGHYLDDDDEV